MQRCRLSARSPSIQPPPLAFALKLSFLVFSMTTLAHAAGNDERWTAAAQEPPGGAAKAQEPTPTPRQAATVRSGEELARVQAAVGSVRAPDVAALAGALDIEPAESNEDFADAPASSLVALGDLDGGGVSELAFKHVEPTVPDDSNKNSASAPLTWQLILLAWDGERWRASQLSQGFEPFELRVVSSLVPGSRQIALVVYGGATAIPFPAVYQVKDHAAALLWDGRADDSQYEGHAEGKVDFREPQSGSPPEMIATGRADPGLIQFAKDGRRGFEVRAVYAWDGKSYLPKKTEYSDNEDYRLYQFISALHLHDFRSAYALIDPAKFLKTAAPSREIFRKQMEDSWPEFLDDEIFEAREPGANAAEDFAFELNSEDKHYVYNPSFSADSKRLLTGLERREEKGETSSH
jgi:hypothetical protein